jgi:hypothetical protein
MKQGIRFINEKEIVSILENNQKPDPQEVKDV